MAGNVVWITGGAGGIGSSLARILVDRGDRVVLFGRTNETIEALAAELGASAIGLSGDARKPVDLVKAVDAGLAAFGRIDGLAHCVGSIRLKPMHLTTPEEFSETIDQNLTSAFLASIAALAPMRAQNSGSIVLVSSVAARQGLNNHETIGAAKAGIEGLVRSSSITYARQNIRFNAVAPALTDTPLAAPFLRSDAARNFSQAMHPLGRIGRPEEVARAIAFLLGNEAAWITGQVLGVDGGLGAGIAPPRATVAS